MMNFERTMNNDNRHTAKLNMHNVISWPDELMNVTMKN